MSKVDPFVFQSNYLMDPSGNDPDMRLKPFMIKGYSFFPTLYVHHDLNPTPYIDSVHFELDMNTELGRHSEPNKTISGSLSIPVGKKLDEIVFGTFAEQASVIFQNEHTKGILDTVSFKHMYQGLWDIASDYLRKIQKPTN